MHQPYKGCSGAEQVGGFALAHVLNVTFQKVQCEAALRAVAVFLCSLSCASPAWESRVCSWQPRLHRHPKLSGACYPAFAIVGFTVSCVRPHP